MLSVLARMYVCAAQVKKAQTLTEKILARHSNNASVVPGQNIWTNVDKLMTHDVCGPGTFGIFQREFGENAQVRRAPPLSTVSANHATAIALQSAACDISSPCVP